MALFLLLAIIGLPIAEIAVLIQAGKLIGVGPTIGLILLTAILGTALLRAQGMRTLDRARASLDRGEPPVGELFDGLCLFAAGGLLLLPGFITDVIGLLLFVPPVRRVLGRAVLAALMKRGGTRIWVGGADVRWPGGDRRGGRGARGGVVIDADYTEVRPDDAQPEDRNRALPREDSPWRGNRNGDGSEEDRRDPEGRDR